VIDLQKTHQNYLQWIQTAEFKKDYKAKLSQKWIYVVAWILILTGIGIPLGIGMIIGRSLKKRKINKSLEEAPTTLASYHPCMAQTLMANTQLWSKTVLQCPALFCGAPGYNSEAYLQEVESVSHQLFTLYGSTPTDFTDPHTAQACREINSDEFVEGRKRHFPPLNATHTLQHPLLLLDIHLDRSLMSEFDMENPYQVFLLSDTDPEEAPIQVPDHLIVWEQGSPSLT